jgi:VIT1/CCC1 family predicted Fe2+/Mn2+ transporter
LGASPDLVVPLIGGRSETAAEDISAEELREMPVEVLDVLAQIYQDKGLTPDLAAEVARQLTAHDALGAHAEAELGIDPEALTNPWHAAWASMAAFTLGALLPLLAILLPPATVRIWVTAVAVVVALAFTGWGSARLGRAPVRPAVLRNIAGGMLAMLVTYAIGALVGTQL